MKTENKKPNSDLFDLMAEKHVKRWQVAAELGISETYFYRKAHFELSPEEKEKWIEAIHRAAKDE